MNKIVKTYEQHTEETKEVKYSNWELNDKVDKIISSNITEVPWEGKEIDTYSMKEDFLNFLYEIAPQYKPND